MNGITTHINGKLQAGPGDRERLCWGWEGFHVAWHPHLSSGVSSLALPPSAPVCGLLAGNRFPKHESISPNAGLTLTAVGTQYMLVALNC